MEHPTLLVVSTARAVAAMRKVLPSDPFHVAWKVDPLDRRQFGKVVVIARDGRATLDDVCWAAEHVSSYQPPGICRCS